MIAHAYLLALSCTASYFTSSYGACKTGESCFPCHCFRDEECGQMICPSGCAIGILGYNWKGRGCQIGNVSPGKVTNQTGPVTSVTFKGKAIDGKIGTFTDCEEVNSYLGSGLAEWWLDLGDFYRVFNMSIFFTTHLVGGAEGINSEFQVGVSNSSNDEIICVKYDMKTAVTLMHIDCPASTVGRYVHFSRLPGSYEQYKATLCEVLVIGHRYIDCSGCPAGIQCTNVLGCDTCSGRYRPDCKMRCNMGSYGDNCDDTCGQCLIGSTCDTTTGHCLSGCTTWWVGDKCKTKLEFLPVDNTSVSVEVVNTTSSSINLRWYQPLVATNMSKFYGYQVRYHQTSGAQTPIVRNVPYLPGSASNIQAFGNLQPYTQYSFEVQPYKDWDGSYREFDTSYPVKLRASTSCPADPATPVMERLNITTLAPLDEKDVTRDQIEVVYRPSPISTHCENITHIVIEYRLVDMEQYSIQDDVIEDGSYRYMITPRYGGTYQVRIRVHNADGMQSVSDVANITVRGPARVVTPVTDAVPNLKLIVSCVVAGLGVILIIIVAIVLYKKCTRETSASRSSRPTDGRHTDGRPHRRTVHARESSH